MTFYGEKYDQLESLRPIAEQQGVFVPPSFGIDQETLDSVLADNSLPSIAEADGVDGLERNIEDGGLEELLVAGSQELHEVFSGPVVMRSSGRGDAVGVGVYDSEVHGSNPDNVMDAFNQVLGSYFTDRATNYRQGMGLESGFGIFMQPVVGSVADKTRDRWADIMDDKETDGDQPVFLTPLSGNVRIGTARSPLGTMRLEEGFGSAVADGELPLYDLSETQYDDEPLDFIVSERSIREVSHRSHRSFDHRGLTLESDGRWEKNYRYGAFLDRVEDEVTLGGLKTQIIGLHESLGGTPTYLEFAMRQEGLQTQLYIVQKGDLASSSAAAVDIESIPSESIMLQGINVEAGGNNRHEVGSIVCLLDRNKRDLYAFDKTEEAESGYILAFPADKCPRSSRVDMAELKNAKGVITLESMSWSHSAKPEDHLIGFSDQLGIPLLSITDSTNTAWQILNGYSWEEGKSEGRHEGDIIVRSGDFIVAATHQEGVIARSS